MTAARRACLLWLALCASLALLFGALAWQAAGRGPVWPVALFAFLGFMSVPLALAGAAAGILADREAHHGPPAAAAGLAARDEYVIPPAPAHGAAWQTRPWRPHNPAEARIGQQANGHSEVFRRQGEP